MGFLLGFVAFLLLPFVGMGIIRLDAVQKLDRWGRIAAAFGAGSLLSALAMAGMSLVGIGWSRTTLLAVLGVLAFGGWMVASPQSRPPRKMPVPWGILAFIVLTIYGLGTARESCGDLHFFWGPKAVHFYQLKGIDLDYLRGPDQFMQHRDYPPLVPLLYAWSNTVSRDFSFGAAVMATGLFLFGSVFLVRGASGDDRGALLVAAILSWATAFSFSAGGADPPLLFFETLTLVALTFLRQERGADVLAAIGLAGAVWAKVEGLTFVIAVVLAMILVQRSWREVGRALRRGLIVAAPAAVLLGAWLAFIIRNHLLDTYRGPGNVIHFEALPLTIELAARWVVFPLYGLPWLVPIALIAWGNLRRAAFPLLVAVLTAGATIFYYLHAPDPSWWIMLSARRVLMTPLLALLIAAVASSSPIGKAPSSAGAVV